MDINWDAVKTVYITTQLSVPKVAAQFGLKTKTVSERCRKDGWVAARMAFRAQVAARTLDSAVDIEADKLRLIISAADNVIAILDRVSKDPDQFFRHVVTDTEFPDDGGKNIITREKIFDAVNSKALRDVGATIKDMMFVQRNLHNLPTQAEAEAQRIAAERLKLEQRKVDAAEAANQVDKSIVVRLEGDLEAYAK